MSGETKRTVPVVSGTFWRLEVLSAKRMGTVLRFHFVKRSRTVPPVSLGRAEGFPAVLEGSPAVSLKRGDGG